MCIYIYIYIYIHIPPEDRSVIGSETPNPADIERGPDRNMP